MTKIVRGILPASPTKYDAGYFNQLSRAINYLIDDVKNPLTNISNIATEAEANSLQVGDVYEADGAVKIVRQTDIFSGSHQATSAIGSVTVTIT
jgi:hypothetical protein